MRIGWCCFIGDGYDGLVFVSRPQRTGPAESELIASIYCFHLLLPSISSKSVSSAEPVHPQLCTQCATQMRMHIARICTPPPRQTISGRSVLPSFFFALRPRRYPPSISSSCVPSRTSSRHPAYLIPMSRALLRLYRHPQNLPTTPARINASTSPPRTPIRSLYRLRFTCWRSHSFLPHTRQRGSVGRERREGRKYERVSA